MNRLARQTGNIFDFFKDHHFRLIFLSFFLGGKPLPESGKGQRCRGGEQRRSEGLGDHGHERVTGSVLTGTSNEGRCHIVCFGLRVLDILSISPTVLCTSVCVCLSCLTIVCYLLVCFL